MRIAVTGCSGYLAGQLIPHLLADPEIDEVIGIDVTAPRFQPPGMTFVQRDDDLDMTLIDLNVDARAYGLNPHCSSRHTKLPIRSM